MTRRGGWKFVGISAVALSAGCFLDTAPIVAPESASTGPVMRLDAGSSVSEPPEMLPTTSGPDAAVVAHTDAAIATGAGGQAPTVTPPPAVAGSSAPIHVADAGRSMPQATQCTGLGSYGLRATLDVTWAATSWSDVGRGTVELYGLLQTDSVDPQMPATSAKFRVCGLTLPTLDSGATCSSYQLQFPDSTWAGSQLPEHELGASYECDATSCVLQLAPISYALGIRLTDSQGPWPRIEETSLSQFADDDADGFAGVSVDVMSSASVAWGQSACTSSGTGPKGPNNPTTTPGPGMPGNPNPMTGTGPGGQTPTQAMPALIGRLPLGLRSQLTAAMTFTPDCQLSGATASDAAISMRAAGCFFADGTDPASANTSCSEELRASVDQSLPSYDVLDRGKRPKQSGLSDKRSSDGPVLRAVRFAPGAPSDCAQVRSAMF